MRAPQTSGPPADDAIELGELLRHLRRGSPWILGGVVVGLAAAAAFTALARPRYDASSKVLLRNFSDARSGALSRLGGLADIIAGGGNPAFESELEILTSRAVVGAVVDSLGLQVRVLEPRATPVSALFARVAPAERIEGPLRYTFRRSGNAYVVEGPGAGSATVRPGGTAVLPAGRLTLRASGLPDEFQVEVDDRRDAVAGVERRLVAEKTAGEVAELEFSAPDPATAAAVPNALVAKYLQRRAVQDRGVNRYRYDFLVAHTDSIRRQLAAAEDQLREHQERSGVLDPELSGRTEVERAMVLQGEGETLDVERRALRRMLEGLSSGRLSVQEIAAYPAFLRNPAISELTSHILTLRTKRQDLLERRTEEDPEVLAMTQSIRASEAQLASMSRAYLEGLDKQAAEVQTELAGYRGELAALPAAAQVSYRLMREVRRLGETLVALQSQLVQTRLAAMAEGGDVQQIDPAVPPRHPAFPSLPVNLAAGLLGGLILGVAAALGRGYLDPRVRDVSDALRAGGIPAIPFDPRAPLLLHGIADRRSVLVLPLRGGDGYAVGERIAEAAALQGRDVALLELDAATRAAPRALAPREEVPTEGSALPVEYGVQRRALGRALSRDAHEKLLDMERTHSLVVAVASGPESPWTTALLSPDRPVVLVGRAGSLRVDELRATVDALHRGGANAAALVLQNGASGGAPDA